MEFRSYYAGKTVIRATSSGLKDATIQITSRGEPKFIPGKTPAVKPRPYLRFSAAQGNASTLTLGMNNPTTASSEAPAHSGRFANDGSGATFWQANPGDKNPWLAVDLERIAAISGVKVTFPSDGNWQYRVEISDDGKSGWKLVSDQSATANTAKTQTLTAASGARGRFLRVSFMGTPNATPAALAELEATGNLITQ